MSDCRLALSVPMLFGEAGCKGFSDERQGRVGWLSAMGQSKDECHSEAGVGIYLLGENREKIRRLVENATCEYPCGEPHGFHAGVRV